MLYSLCCASLPRPQGFEYQGDPPKSKVASLAFPSLAQALAVPWVDLVKRHFPLSETFVRSRVLHKFRYMTGWLIDWPAAAAADDDDDCACCSMYHCSLYKLIMVDHGYTQLTCDS